MRHWTSAARHSVLVGAGNYWPSCLYAHDMLYAMEGVTEPRKEGLLDVSKESIQRRHCANPVETSRAPDSSCNAPDLRIGKRVMNE